MNEVQIEDIDPILLKRLGHVITLLQKYHRHEVFGIEKIPQNGRALLLFNHSLATYDIFMFGYQLYLETGRAGCGLGDSKLFAFEKSRSLMKKIHGFEAKPETAESLLKQEQLVFLAPGGMREALRPTTESPHVMWEKRKGFVRLALKTQSPVILCACPNADKIFNIYPSFLTKWVYQNFKLPFALARGIGPTLTPRPVKLDHYVSDPILPPKISEDDPNFEKETDQFHIELIEKMESLLHP